MALLWSALLVWRARRRRPEALQAMQLYRSNGDKRERERKHRLAGFLGDAPNEAMTWTQLREALLYTMILRGNAHARCFWSGGFVREMFPLPL
ncbi:phage portal protein [Luteolibacter sp. GHJ8]|uniref:Phage portal protein n=1 Tax=Luteolibacter rhizosphaerae TaxID=2989719 RepID=A0ABT3G955_9BACT|nr:phage portal protein [Luteolibacter rhizosphaerae]MCW1916004.1 phage portal protein [Luteolibacter rhizosphaerae]